MADKLTKLHDALVAKGVQDGDPSCDICNGTGYVPMLNIWQINENGAPIEAYDSVDAMPFLEDCPCGQCRKDDHTAWCEALYTKMGNPFRGESE